MRKVVQETGSSSSARTSMREPFGRSKACCVTLLAGRSVAAIACTLTDLCLRCAAVRVPAGDVCAADQESKHLQLVVQMRQPAPVAAAAGQASVP